MSEILLAIDKLEAYMSEAKMAPELPVGFAERCAYLLKEAPSMTGLLWDPWKSATVAMACAVEFDAAMRDAIWPVFFDGIADVRRAFTTQPDLVPTILATVTDRFELFRPAPAVAPSEESPTDALDGEMREAFIGEATELLQQIEACVISLQSDPKSVERLFRVMHTLKGSSGMVGMTAMNKLAHAAEEILEKIRDGSLAPTVALEEALLKSKDVLAECVARLENRQDTEIDVSGMIVQLRDSISGKAPAAAPPSAAVAPPAPDRSALVAPSAPPHAPEPSPPSAAKEPARKESGGTIRINQEKLDEVFERMGQVVIGRIRLESLLSQMGLIIASKSDPAVWRARVVESHEALGAALEEYSRAHAALQERVMSLRLAPVGTVFDRFPRVVRETARKLGKEIDFTVIGADVEIDKGICEAIVDPLIHLLRNAIDHGIESPDERIDRGKSARGRLTIAASYRGDRVMIEVFDDGKGMDPNRIGTRAVEKGIITQEEFHRLDERERLMLIFRAGFSTAEQVSDLSGRGVGMDVVRDVIERLKGSVEVESTPGAGSRISLLLPLTLALVELLIVSVGDAIVAFPLYVVRETLRLDPDEVERAGDRPVISVRGSYLPLVSLADVLGITARDATGPLHCVVVEVMGEAVALNVDGFLERSEAVLKPLGDLLVRAPFVSGATILGDGRIVPVLDPVPIVREAGRRSVPQSGATPSAIGPAPRRGRVLVVEDSDTMARQLSSILKRAGFTVTIAVDGVDALDRLRKQPFDIVSTDIVMPRMDGYELCRRLRAEPRFEALPVVALSSRIDKLDRIKGFESGIDEYLPKPVDENVYVAVIERMLERRGTAVR